MVQAGTVASGGPLFGRLRRVLRGVVLAPGDAGYDDARAVYFTSIDRRPAAVVRVADAEDVVGALRLARDAGVELTVRSGGHSIVGHGLVDGGVAIDTTALGTLEIDASERIARAGGGLTAGAYTKAAGEHGLATNFGDSPSVGIAGLTLSGGIGFLHRKHGMTIDHLLAAELVTADGSIVRASADSHPELFWAIRGGGGNFGVVTRFEYRLHPVDTVLGGMLLLPATAARIVAFLEAASSAPDELSLIMMVAPAPPLPGIPPEHVGRPVIMAVAVYAGAIEDGERAVAPLRALGTPIVDALRPMPYPSIYEGVGPHPAAVAIRTRFLDGLDVAAAAAILEHLACGTAPMRAVQFRPLGGAVARVAPGETAFAHRDRRFLVNVAAMFGDAAQDAEHRAWVGGLADALGAARPGAYVAFLGPDGAERIGEAYPAEALRRLAEVKRRYDPDNTFRHNQNVLPA